MSLHKKPRWCRTERRVGGGLGRRVETKIWRSPCCLVLSRTLRIPRSLNSDPSRSLWSCICQGRKTEMFYLNVCWLYISIINIRHMIHRPSFVLLPQAPHSRDGQNKCFSWEGEALWRPELLGWYCYRVKCSGFWLESSWGLPVSHSGWTLYKDPTS